MPEDDPSLLVMLAPVGYCEQLSAGRGGLIALDSRALYADESRASTTSPAILGQRKASATGAVEALSATPAAPSPSARRANFFLFRAIN